MKHSSLIIRLYTGHVSEMPPFVLQSLYMMECFKRTTDCPVCRNGVSLAFDNPSIEKVVNLLVEVSFTEEEKEERDRRIQQRSAAAIAPKNDDDGLPASVTILRAVSDNVLTRRENRALVVVGRLKCLIMAVELLQEIFTTTIPDDENLREIVYPLNCLVNDLKSIDSILNVIMEKNDIFKLVFV